MYENHVILSHFNKTMSHLVSNIFHNLSLSVYFSVMEVGEGEERGQSADAAAEHIPLRVPHVTLRAEKGLRSIAESDGGKPFDNFEDSAESHAHHEYDNDLPDSFIGNHLVPKQYFTEKYRRNKALSKMSDPVVVVAGKSENIFHPFAERNLLVGIITSDHKYHAMNG